MSAALQAVRGWLLGPGSYALVLALPIILVFAHRGMAPVLIVMAIAAASAPQVWRGLAAPFANPFEFRRPQTAAPLSVAAFALWILVSGLWSPRPGAINLTLIIGAAALAGYFAVAGIFARDARAMQTFKKAYLWACLIALALLAFEAASGGYLRLITPPADHSPDRFKDITALGRGLTALLPALFALGGFYALGAAQAEKKKRVIHLVALAAIAFAAFVTALKFTIAANALAIPAGAGAALLAYFYSRRAAAGLTFAYVGALVLTPVLGLIPAASIIEHVGAAAPASWLQRLFIWRHAAREALACLPLGCGADYARAVGEKGLTVAVPGAPAPLPLTPIHPHDAFLQIWLELGLPGVVLTAIFLFACGRLLQNARLGPATTAALVGAGVATLVSLLVEASLWQMWRLAAIGFGGCGLALLYRFECDASRKAGAL